MSKEKKIALLACKVGNVNKILVAPEIDRMVMWEDLQRAMSQLGKKTRTVLNLHYGLGYKLSEIARAQGQNYSSIKSVHIRGIKKLRQLMEDERSAQDE